MYKHAAPFLANILGEFMQRWWCGAHPYIPQSFKDAWLRLIMLMKPGRLCRGPSDLRPIGLSHPLGKAMLRALRQKILPYAEKFMHHVPQWGFMPRREASDALARAFRHCEAVRSLCKMQTLSINSRWEGKTRTALAGGLAVALDISKAFDSIPHAEINSALQAASVPVEIRRLVLCWITGAQYHAQGDNGTIAVDVCRGVRQGCVLSPLLYVLVVARLHSQLRETIGAEADQLLDYYAYDTLFHAEFDSVQGLRIAIGRAEQLLECLTKAGLQTNDDKTQVLLKLSGSKSKQILRDITEMRRGKRHLRIFTLWTQRTLPIVDKAKYLGAQLSYESFEDATNRVVAARAACGRLRRILTSRSNLSLASRVKLWSACVGTCLYYALDSCGVTLSGLQKIRVLVQKHLRAISRTPAHITRVGNQELLDQLGVQEPGAYILRNMEGQLERWQANQRHTEPIPIKAKSDIGEWRCSVQQSLRDMLQKENVAGRSLLQCPKCGLECANKTVLGSHMATAHAKGERPVFDRLRHSLGGRPRCSGCKELLSSWARLQKHIEHGACPLPIGDRMLGSLDTTFQSEQTQAVAPDPDPLTHLCASNSQCLISSNSMDGVGCFLTKGGGPNLLSGAVCVVRGVLPIGR